MATTFLLCISGARMTTRAFLHSMSKRRGLSGAAGLSVVIFILLAAAVSDTLEWMRAREALQENAQSAALAGAKAVAQSRQLEPTVASHLAGHKLSGGQTKPMVELVQNFGDFSGQLSAVRVRLDSQLFLPFSGRVLGQPTQISVEATAPLSGSQPG